MTTPRADHKELASIELRLDISKAIPLRFAAMGKLAIVVSLSFGALAACGPSRAGTTGPDADHHGSIDAPPGGGGDAPAGGYNVYAHSDGVLYTIDLQTKALVTVGNFNAPPPTGSSTPDVITDLAVAPDGTIYVNSETALYTASPMDGHVTLVGSLSTCGTKAVALTTTSDGRLWMGDYMGAICQIDISVSPPTVGAPVTMSNGMALAGDMVGVDNGTVFGTAYSLGTSSTQNDNSLVKIDVATGTVTMIGASGFPKLFGVSFANNQVFGFTHDGTGRVVTIDTSTGVGTMFGTFMDPMTSKGISFAGAGVNSLVVIE